MPRGCGGSGRGQRCAVLHFVPVVIPSKGSRFIEVDGVAYRWRIRKKSTYVQAAFEASMHVAIQACADDAKSVLVVDLRVSRPDNWIARTRPRSRRRSSGTSYATRWRRVGNPEAACLP